MILVMAFILPSEQFYVMEMDVSKIFPLKKNQKQNKTLPNKDKTIKTKQKSKQTNIKNPIKEKPSKTKQNKRERKMEPGMTAVLPS